MPTCSELNAFSDIPAIKIFLLMKLNARVNANAKMVTREVSAFVEQDSYLAIGPQKRGVGE